MDAVELAEQIMAAILDYEGDAFYDVQVLDAAEAGLAPGTPAFALHFRYAGRTFVVTVKERERPGII
jgi:hypothetical protein